MLPASVADRLGGLAPDQRRAATAPPGPILCVAPAGSGKAKTLVARIAWLVATGADPATITAVTFNKRAADEMAARVDAALEPLGLAAGSVRVNTFHALGREILADGDESVDPLLDREAVLRDMWPDITRGAIRHLDDAFSRLKLEIGVTAARVATDPQPGPVARAFLAYEQALEDAGGLDFDDLVARAVRLLEARPPLLRRWRAKCEHLLVDEVQDVDRTQLQLALALAAPRNQVLFVGDDDQSLIASLPVPVRQAGGRLGPLTVAQGPIQAFVGRACDSTLARDRVPSPTSSWARRGRLAGKQRLHERGKRIRPGIDRLRFTGQP
jgi:DNA helicase-2/ATP-dependent DNA helicase PcrA